MKGRDDEPVELGRHISSRASGLRLRYIVNEEVDLYNPSRPAYAGYVEGPKPVSKTCFDCCLIPRKRATLKLERAEHDCIGLAVSSRASGPRRRVPTSDEIWTIGASHPARAGYVEGHVLVAACDYPRLIPRKRATLKASHQNCRGRDGLGLSSAPARALQIYLILIGCAANQQVITYGRLAERVGLLTPTWLFVSLDRLAEWCLKEGLPPITSLAVAEDTGAPGPGYRLPLQDLAAQQNRARKFDWYAIVPPTVAELELNDLQAAE